MNILNLFKKEEKRSNENGQLPYTINDLIARIFITNGEAVGNYYPLNLPAVFRAVELISDSVAMLPIRVVRKNKESEIIGHYIDKVFEENLNGLNKFNFVKKLITDVLTEGCAYAYIVRNQGKVEKLMWLPYQSVVPQYSPSGRIELYICSKLNKQIQPEDMLHFVRHYDNALQGRPNSFYANRTIIGASAAENLTTKNFANGGLIKGIMTKNDAGTTITPQMKNELYDKWKNELGGINGPSVDAQRNDLLILPYNLSFQPIQTTASEAQLLQNRQFYVEDVARFYGINPVLLGDLSHTSWQTLETAQQDFVLHCLQGWIIMVEEELTKKLLNPIEREEYKFDLDEKVIIKTDKQAEANYYSTLLNNGVLSVNEVRHALGLEDIEGGDTHIIPFTDINQNQLNNTNKEDGGTKELQ